MHPVSTPKSTFETSAASLVDQLVQIKIKRWTKWTFARKTYSIVSPLDVILIWGEVEKHMKNVASYLAVAS